MIETALSTLNRPMSFLDVVVTILAYNLIVIFIRPFVEDFVEKLDDKKR